MVDRVGTDRTVDLLGEGGRSGPPSKFTDEVCQRLLLATRQGAPRDEACAYAGVDRSTLRAWELLALEPDAPERVVRFVEDLRRAEGEAAVSGVALIRKAAQDGSWQAAAWLLERRFPESFGRREVQRVEVSGPGGGPVVGSGGGVDRSEVVALQGLLARRDAIETSGVEVEEDADGDG